MSCQAQSISETLRYMPRALRHEPSTSRKSRKTPNMRRAPPLSPKTESREPVSELCDILRADTSPQTDSAQGLPRGL